MTIKQIQNKIKDYLNNPFAKWTTQPLVYTSSENKPPLNYFHPLKVEVSDVSPLVEETLCDSIFINNTYTIELTLGHVIQSNKNVLISYVNDLLNFFTTNHKLETANLIKLKESTPGNWELVETDVDDDYKLHRFIGDTLETGQEYYGYEVTYNNKLYLLFREYSQFKRWGIFDPETHIVINIHQTDKTGFVIENGKKRIAIRPTGDSTLHFFDFVTKPLLTGNQDLVIEDTNSVSTTFDTGDIGEQVYSTIFLTVEDRDKPEIIEPIVVPDTSLVPSHVFSPVIQNDKYVISAVSDQNVFHMSDWDAGNLVKNSFEVVPPSISNGDYLAFGSTVPLKGIQEKGNVFGNVFSAFNASGVGMTRGVCFYTYVSKNTYFANANPRSYVLTEDDSFADKVMVSYFITPNQPQAGQFLFTGEDDLDPTRNHKDISISSNNAYVAIAFSGGQLLRIMDGTNNIRNNFLPRVDQPFIQRVIRGTIYNIFVSQTTYNVVTSWTIFY